MTCYFHAFGPRFDVNAYVKRSKLPVGNTYISGERRFPNSKTNKARYRNSGFSIRIGSETSWELRAQVRAVLKFLKIHKPELKKLSKCKGVKLLNIDFGVDAKEEALGQFFPLPPELVALCGALNIGLEISIYRWCEFEESQRKKVQFQN